MHQFFELKDLLAGKAETYFWPNIPLPPEYPFPVADNNSLVSLQFIGTPSLIVLQS